MAERNNKAKHLRMCKYLFKKFLIIPYGLHYDIVNDSG